MEIPEKLFFFFSFCELTFGVKTFLLCYVLWSLTLGFPLLCFFGACEALTRIYEELLHLSVSIFHEDSSINIFYFFLTVIKRRDNQ